MHAADAAVIDARGKGALQRRRFATGALAAMTLVYVALVDPHRVDRAVPRCPVKLMTGLECPACGGVRLAYDVVHGDTRAAVHDNVFLLACTPLLSALLWRGLAADETGDAVPRPVAYALGVSALAWMVVRNLPGWPLKPIRRP